MLFAFEDLMREGVFFERLIPSVKTTSQDVVIKRKKIGQVGRIRLRHVVVVNLNVPFNLCQELCNLAAVHFIGSNHGMKQLHRDIA